MCVFHIEDPGSVLQGYSHESATSGGWQQRLWNLQSWCCTRVQARKGTRSNLASRYLGDQNLGTTDIFQHAQPNYPVLLIGRKGKERMLVPCRTPQHRAEHWRSWPGSSSILRHRAPQNGEAKLGFPVSCLCWLLSAREITSKGLSNFLSHPRKQEKALPPPLRSWWPGGITSLVGRAAQHWAVRQSSVTSYGVSCLTAGFEETLKKWILTESPHCTSICVTCSGYQTTLHERSQPCKRTVCYKPAMKAGPGCDLSVI